MKKALNPGDVIIANDIWPNTKRHINKGDILIAIQARHATHDLNCYMLLASIDDVVVDMFVSLDEYPTPDVSILIRAKDSYREK